MASTKSEAREQEQEQELGEGGPGQSGEETAIEIVTGWQSSETAQVCLEMKISWVVGNTAKMACTLKENRGERLWNDFFEINKENKLGLHQFAVKLVKSKAFSYDNFVVHFAQCICWAWLLWNGCCRLHLVHLSLERHPLRRRRPVAAVASASCLFPGIVSFFGPHVSPCGRRIASRASTVRVLYINSWGTAPQVTRVRVRAST